MLLLVDATTGEQLCGEKWSGVKRHRQGHARRRGRVCWITPPTACRRAGSGMALTP